MGGKDCAPQPVEYLLAALIGCETATAAYVSRHVRPRLQIERIRFDYTADRDENGSLELPIGSLPSVPARLLSIQGTAEIVLRPGATATSAQVSELHQLVEQRCPI